MVADPNYESGTSLDADALFRLRHVVRNVPERRLAPTGRPGGFVGKRKGTGLEIVDVRPFADGDDARHVDAATTARTGRTHVRTFRDEREKAALLIADFRPSMFWGTRGRWRSVAAAETLMLAGWRVIEAGGRVAFAAIGEGDPVYVPAKAGDAGMATLAGAMSRAHQAALDAVCTGRRLDVDLDVALEKATRLLPRGATLFLATGLDRPGAEFDLLVEALRRRANLVVLLVRDRFETDPPSGAYPFVTTGLGTGQNTAFDRLRWCFVAKGRRGDRARRDGRAERLERLGVEVRIVPADASAEDLARHLEPAFGGIDGPGR